MSYAFGYRSCIYLGIYVFVWIWLKWQCYQSNYRISLLVLFSCLISDIISGVQRKRSICRGSARYILFKFQGCFENSGTVQILSYWSFLSLLESRVFPMARAAESQLNIFSLHLPGNDTASGYKAIQPVLEVTLQLLTTSYPGTMQNYKYTSLHHDLPGSCNYLDQVAVREEIISLYQNGSLSKRPSIIVASSKLPFTKAKMREFIVCFVY